ncbi:PaaI family thioesterase [Pseudoruegeria sp. SK021]|uniref:PaaI family thioesterase n=1 Tax=Pseudoruegeria sp. SK021 TaxID=1933035 RepID=UPI000A24121E|nr:PaaI family thioesterase [Pseudoruegeria sp. SK021]OSP56316.1 thioesterase [Pseudoruegeria sp. SK021]
MTDTPDDDRLAQARAFVAALPYCAALRIGVDRVGPAEVVLTLPYHRDLIGDPATGVIHGGAVSALMDTCCGAAVMTHPEVAGAAATLDLRIDYMRGAVPGQTVRAHAVCTHVTRSIAFVRATAFDCDGGQPIATAVGAFSVTDAAQVPR